MNNRLLSSEMLHASSVAMGGRAVLITGPSGARFTISLPAAADLG